MNRFLAVLTGAFTAIFLYVFPSIHPSIGLVLLLTLFFFDIYFSLLLAFFLSFFSVWTLISPATFYIGMAILFILFGLIAMDVVKKITVLDDELFIRRELLRDWKLIAGFYFVVGFFVMLGPVIGWSMTGWILNEASVGFVFVLGWNSTFWMLERSEVFTVPILMDAVSLKKSGKSQTQRLCDEHGLPSFEQMMEDPVAVATFLKHLVWELSVENLFFLSDVMRFKRTFVTENMIDTMPGFYYDVPHMLSRFVRDLISLFLFYAVCVFSLCRYGYRKERGTIAYAWSISHAYVDNLSAFYITAMDEDERERILEFLTDLKPDEKLEGKKLEDLVCIFDTAARHVFALIKQAHGRFVRNAKLNLKSLNRQVVSGAGGSAGGGGTTTGGGGGETKGQMDTHMSMS